MAFYPYRPREIDVDLGILETDSHVFKVYGIVAENQAIDEATLDDARTYLRNDLTDIIESSQESDGLGFIIVHPGDLGTSVLVHWWIQGSVLCQQVRRWLPDSSEPLDMSKRNVLGCVWELGLINAEQLIWRDTMMGDAANPRNYLATRPDLTKV